MGYLGHKQREQLNEHVGAIKESGGSVSFGGAPIDSGADLARGIEGAMGSDLSAERARDIIDRLQTIKYRMEIFAECRQNPDCTPKPEYSTCDVSIDVDGIMEENWR